MRSESSTTSKKPGSTAEEPPAGSPKGRVVPAVHRACAALWLLSRHPEGLNLSRVARELDMLPSTCLHILRELAAASFVAYSPETKLYALGSGILSLARQLTQRNPFVQVSQPVLNRLSREFDVGASAQERDADRYLMVVAAASVLPGDMVSPGARSALFTSASGRLMACYNTFSDKELRERFDAARWQAAPDFEQWLKQVRTVRRQGYATDEGQFRKGITAIAAPVLNEDGTADRAISITAITAQLDADRREVLVNAVKAAAAEIMEKLR